MIPEQVRAAAEARGRQVRAPGDRPSQRRGQVEPGGGSWTPGIRGSFEVRGMDPGSGPLVFDGMATVYERGYEMWDMFGAYVEFVHLGAGAATLANPDLDVPLVLGHDPMRRLARTGNDSSPLTLTEVNDGDAPGLRVLAPNLDRSDPDVAYVAPKLRSGLLDEMSFRFMIVSGRWNDAWDEYHIHVYDIDRGDVSIVGYGANPHTAGSGLRADSRKPENRDGVRDPHTEMLRGKLLDALR